MRPPTPQVIADAWRTVALFTLYRRQYSWGTSAALTQWTMDYRPNKPPPGYPEQRGE